MTLSKETDAEGCGDGKRVVGPGTHSALPHTADAGLVATASTLPGLFEEAAACLAELAADLEAGVEASLWEDVELEGADLAALAYAWLNELIALAEIRHSAIVTTRVAGLHGPSTDDGNGQWKLQGRVGLCATGKSGVGLLRQPKAATYHGLVVERTRPGWTMRAYLDL